MPTPQCSETDISTKRNAQECFLTPHSFGDVPQNSWLDGWSACNSGLAITFTTSTPYQCICKNKPKKHTAVQYHLYKQWKTLDFVQYKNAITWFSVQSATTLTQLCGTSCALATIKKTHSWATIVEQQWDHIMMDASAVVVFGISRAIGSPRMRRTSWEPKKFQSMVELYLNQKYQ